MLPLPELPLLPFDQATEAQRTQALLTARQAVNSAFPTYSYPQWQQALAAVRPPVQPGSDGEPARFAPPELVALLHQLVLPHPTAPPAAPPSAPAGESFPPKPDRSRTYQLPEALIERLSRLSHWLHLPVNQLVVHALTRLVAHYPAEAARPIPPKPSFP